MMKRGYRLVLYILMTLPWIQLHGQVDASVYPSKPVFDTLRYEKVDENSRPATLSCKAGGYGLYQLNVSETYETEMETFYDTIELKDGKWKLEDLLEYEKKYNETHQQELADLEKQDIDGYRGIQKVCEDVIKDLMNENWNTEDFCLCDPNCKSEMEICYIKSEVLRIRKSKSGYRYETIGTSKLVREDDTNQLEIGIKTILYYEATVYFKVSCNCWDNNVMAQTVPADKGGEYISSTAKGTELKRTVLIATGTGRTTGHIADIKINNTTDTPINVLPQTVYIPSDGQYQPYVAVIPGTTVPPKTTVIIPVTGYCADVHKPPVGSGDGMPPFATWITTTPPPPPTLSGTEYSVVTTVVTPYTPQDIPKIISTPGFTPSLPPKTTPTLPTITPTIITTTWPGTDISVNGTIDPVEYPESFAPVIIEALTKIENAFDELKGEGTLNTPFSGNPEGERESVIQQTFWIFMADITGENYQKEHFQEKVVEQFENSTGTTVAALPEPELKKLNGGVDAFWNVFLATGTTAKVLLNSDNPDSNFTVKTEPNESTPYADDAPDTNCKCGSASLVVIPYLHQKNKKDEVKIQAFKFDFFASQYNILWNEYKIQTERLGSGDSLRIVLDSISLTCIRCDFSDTCEVTDRKVFVLSNGLDKMNTYTEIKANKEGTYNTGTVAVTPPEINTTPTQSSNASLVEVSIKLTWACVGKQGCKRVDCESFFYLLMERKAEEINKEEKSPEKIEKSDK